MNKKAWKVLVAAAVVLGSVSFAWGDNSVGEVRAEGAAIRAGGSMSHFVVAKPETGARLVVVKQLGDWYVVRIPKDVPVYVSTKWVRREGGGDTGIVTGDRVNIRATPDTKYAALGETGRGTVVQILGDAGEWLKIVPPDTAVGWVYKSYLKVVEGMSPDAVQEGYQRKNQENQERRKEDEAKTSQLSASFAAAADAMMKDDFDGAKSLFEQVIVEGKGTSWADRANAQLEIIRNKLDERKKAEEKAIRIAREQGEREKKLIEDLLRMYDAAVEELKPKKPAYVATGTLEGLGMVLLRRGTHKLVDGTGVESYTLRAAKGSGLDLYDSRYFEKKVGVIGRVLEVPNWPSKIIEVSRIDLLE